MVVLVSKHIFTRPLNLFDCIFILHIFKNKKKSYATSV